MNTGPDKGARPWRLGTPRSSGPHRRPATQNDPTEHSFRPQDAVWELWNIRALWPEAELETLARIKRRQDMILAREREALARLWSGDRAILAPGHGFIEAHEELKGGVILSLHIGPYQLLAEPLVAAELEPVILLNENALPTFREPAQVFLKHLGHKKGVTWIPVGRKGFVRELVQAVRANRPVVVYLDGNSGQGGMAETRQLGMTYQLPGRLIRVRTGLARLLCRLGCPVHPLTVHWNDDQQIVWHKEPTRRFSREDSPEEVTQLLYDWAFHQIRQRPEQWHYWAMLRESSACFGKGDLALAAVPEDLREDYQRSFRICLERTADTARLLLESEVEIWPGQVLADLTHDRFFPAAGLQDADLDVLRQETPTLSRLCQLHGRAWVEFHGLRLCLLGLARLGG